MTFFLVSFLAGVLTVLAPCILPLLPVVIGASVSGRSKRTPYVVIISLGISVILFTILLKFSTAFIMVPAEVWTYLSGGILFFFGLTLVFPGLWDRIPGMSQLSIRSNKILGAGYQKNSIWGDVIVGAALGPVFSTCSPTYFIILASVLPASFFLGMIYLLAYTIGLTLVLLLIALLGERFASRLSTLSDPHSRFKKGLGVMFIVLGILIAFGYEKRLETAILESGYFDITRLEHQLLERTQDINSTSSAVPYKEIVNPSGFVNTDGAPVRIADYVGKKVILLDIMTYSCINCQRTFPYVTAWYEKYKDDGLIVIGIHTPEFAFEKDKKNVEDAMKRFGITFPVVLDNDYGTWNAYGNRYWPRKYLIDIKGNVVYDHIGEGAYEETEMKIKELLGERAHMLEGATSLNLSNELAASRIQKKDVQARSPETYFGSLRNEYLGNGIRGRSGAQEFIVPEVIYPNTLYLGGTWNIDAESAGSIKDATVVYRYDAKEVYIVASSDVGSAIEVWQDGKRVDSLAGDDVDANGVVLIKESKLYKLVKNAQRGEHTLELRVKGAGVSFFAFTFG